MIEATIYNRLSTSDFLDTTTGGMSGGFSSGFSNGFAVPIPGRIYAVTPPENTPYPFLVHRAEIEDAPVSINAGPIGLTSFKITIDVWAKTLAESQSMATAVKLLFSGKRWEGVAGCFLAGDSPSELADEEGDIFNRQMTFKLWAKE